MHRPLQKRAAAILLAAGRGRRMGRGVDKLFLRLGGRPVIAHSLSALQKSPRIGSILVTCNDSNRDRLAALIRKHRFTKVIELIRGGRERSDSVALALEKMPAATPLVLIHDGARPFLNEAMISEGLDLAARRGSAVVASKVVDTVKRAGRNLRVTATVDRADLFAVQTPQIFKVRLILQAYRLVRRKRIAVTDDAAALEAAGERVHLYEYRGPNLKVTHPGDLPLAESMMRARKKPVHRRPPGR